MKNSYLILSCLLLSVSAFSQKVLQDIPFHNETETSRYSGDILDAQAKPVSSSSVESTEAHRGGGSAILWEEDFGGGFPSGWVSDDASGINPWKWSMNGSHGNFNNSQGAGYDDPISSTTAGNGFLINDPDSANHATYGQPSGTTYQYLDSYFATTEIDLGASYPSLLLEFEQSFRFNNGVDMVVQVSTDSTNWTDYTVQGTVANNAGSDDPDLVSINISGAVGASQTLFLRIGWSARVYFWMIDDMKIVEGLGNDLAMTNVWHGDINNAFEYQQIPLAQAQEIVIGAACFNLGGTAQPNTVYSYDISDGTSSVGSGTFPATNTSIGSTAGDTTWYATGIVPATVGEYTVTVTVASDFTDELLTNNEAESVFKMTDNIYAHDDEDNIEFIVTGAANGEIPEFKMGLYYETTAAANLTAVQVAFGRLTRASTCIVEVFDVVNDQALSSPIVTEVYDIEPGDVATGNGVTILTDILIDEGSGVQLDADGLYLISIGNTGEGDSLYIEASDGDDDRGQLRYGPFGAGGAVDWYTGYTTSPIIRANFDPTVGIKEAQLAENGFGVYPNPTSNVVTIQFRNELGAEKVSIIDVNGKLVKEIAFGANNNSITADVSDLSSGVYFINVLSVNGTNVQKLIVE